jgi:menaquinone-dependent protoporphyrinogen oxidase
MAPVPSRPIKALVTVASRHGSTHDIAAGIADTLRMRGIEADLRDTGEIDSLDGYDAVVLGSAVYMGAWLAEARHFADSHRAQLGARPLWLFSSGPVGPDDRASQGDPRGVAELARAIHARDHHVFAGKLDPRRLGFGERLIGKVVHAPEGDFRDWDAIRRWADTIADALCGAGHPGQGEAGRQ